MIFHRGLYCGFLEAWYKLSAEKEENRMRPKVAMLVLSGVLICMFSVAWSQNSNTGKNFNAVPNANRATRNSKPSANHADWNANYRNHGAWVDGNTNRPLVNGTWNANANQWDIDANLLYTNAPAANMPANWDPNANWNGGFNISNAATPIPNRKKPVRKKTRRPKGSLGGSLTLGNKLSAMLAAGVS